MRVCAAVSTMCIWDLVRTGYVQQVRMLGCRDIFYILLHRCRRLSGLPDIGVNLEKQRHNNTCFQ
eukprot:jgi/Botrbrau1/1827/Bobra.146_1s0023.1